MSKATVKCMVLIVNRDQGNRIGSICHQHQLYFSYACMASGTASSEYLNYLGLEKRKKSWYLLLRLLMFLHHFKRQLRRQFILKNQTAGLFLPCR